MIIGKFAAISALSLSLAAVPGAALAGDAHWTYGDGTKLRIKCTGAGCTVKAKKPGAKWVVVETGQGGRDNFLVLEAKYKKTQPKL